MKYLLIATTALSGLASAACAAPAPQAVITAASAAILVEEEAAPAVDPAVWKLADEDTTIYILGTFHMLPADYEWRTDTIDTVIAEADELVLEVNAGPEDTAKIQPLIMELGITPGLPPLKERISEDRHERLDQILSGSPIPPQAFDMMDSWFAGLTITQLVMAEYGLTPEAGVEYDLRASFKEAGKPIGELESIREQLGFFDNLSEETQREFLTDALENPEDARTAFDAMLAAWTAGDADGIAKSFVEADMSEELETALLTNRNSKWTEWLDNRLDQPGTILVAVGAGHLVGEDSVVDMLEERGFEVTRIDD